MGTVKLAKSLFAPSRHAISRLASSPTSALAAWLQSRADEWRMQFLRPRFLYASCPTMLIPKCKRVGCCQSAVYQIQLEQPRYQPSWRRLLREILPI
ncbi:hypothetical protein BCR44DRAFT_1153381 [Catenaria anguillulae PL171]|uniref:Uncharacterized protein n=1 Tax=Catenaria anguillulae PL171 TaxID=765915 RepID=A0A1Y2HKS0_9FUNG|nr:hypothetical protein BCR44DRAFT_1153381 [Catenaria anguillulae PL171]